MMMMLYDDDAILTTRLSAEVCGLTSWLLSLKCTACVRPSAGGSAEPANAHKIPAAMHKSTSSHKQIP